MRGTHATESQSMRSENFMRKTIGESDNYSNDLSADCVYNNSVTNLRVL